MVARGSAAVVARVLAIEVDPLEASLVDAMLAVREPPESVMPSWPPPLTGLRGTLAEPGGRSVFAGPGPATATSAAGEQAGAVVDNSQHIVGCCQHAEAAPSEASGRGRARRGRASRLGDRADEVGAPLGCDALSGAFAGGVPSVDLVDAS